MTRPSVGRFEMEKAASPTKQRKEGESETIPVKEGLGEIKNRDRCVARANPYSVTLEREVEKNFV